MSLFRCGGGGGKLEETVLWTNPSPTATFATQTITLSDDMTKYDFLKIEWDAATDQTSSADNMIIPVVDFINSRSSATYGPNYTLTSLYNGSTFGRITYYVSDNQIYIESAYRIKNDSTQNKATIPLKIYGMKYGNKRPVTPSGTRTLLWENPSPSSSLTSLTVTLPQSVNDFAYIEVKWYGNTDMNDQATIIIPVNELNGDTSFKGWARYAMAMNNTTTGAYARPVAFPSDTQVRFGTCGYWAGGSGTLATGAIPYRINGIS